MPKIVDVAGTDDQVEFPDEMTDGQIAVALRDHYMGGPAGKPVYAGRPVGYEPETDILVSVEGALPDTPDLHLTQKPVTGLPGDASAAFKPAPEPVLASVEGALPEMPPEAPAPRATVFGPRQPHPRVAPQIPDIGSVPPGIARRLFSPEQNAAIGQARGASALFGAGRAAMSPLTDAILEQNQIAAERAAKMGQIKQLQAAQEQERASIPDDREMAIRSGFGLMPFNAQTTPLAVPARPGVPLTPSGRPIQTQPPPLLPAPVGAALDAIEAAGPRASRAIAEHFIPPGPPQPNTIQEVPSGGEFAPSSGELLPNITDEGLREQSRQIIAASQPTTTVPGFALAMATPEMIGLGAATKVLGLLDKAKTAEAVGRAAVSYFSAEGVVGGVKAGAVLVDPKSTDEERAAAIAQLPTSLVMGFLAPMHAAGEMKAREAQGADRAAEGKELFASIAADKAVEDRAQQEQMRAQILDQNAPLQPAERGPIQKGTVQTPVMTDADRAYLAGIEGRQVGAKADVSSQPADVKITHDVRDSHRGETFGSVYATAPDGTRVGRLDYSEYDGKVGIQNIEVAQEYRRQGIATKMREKLQTEWPESEVGPFGDVLTPEGQAFEKSAAAPPSVETVPEPVGEGGPQPIAKEQPLDEKAGGANGEYRHVTFEAVSPGWLQKMSPEDRQSYTDDIMDSVDLAGLARAAGLEPGSIKRSPGYYGGESNPAIHLDVALPPGVPGAQIVGRARSLAAALGKIHNQESVAYVIASPAKSEQTANLVRFDFGRPLERDEALRMGDAVAKLGDGNTYGAYISPHGNGVLAGLWGETDVDPVVRQRELTRVVEENTPDGVSSTRVLLQNGGGLVFGGEYDSEIQTSDARAGRPDLQGRVDSDRDQVAAAKKYYADKYGAESGGAEGGVGPEAADIPAAEGPGEAAGGPPQEARPADLVQQPGEALRAGRPVELGPEPGRGEVEAAEAPGSAVAFSPKNPPPPPPPAAPPPGPSLLGDAKRLDRLGRVIIRRRIAERSRRDDVDAESFSEWDKHFDTPNLAKPSDEIERIAKSWEAAGKGRDAAHLREFSRQVQIMDDIDAGRPLADSSYAGFGETWARKLRVARQELMGLGHDRARGWTQDYFAHFWKDPKAVQTWLQKFMDEPANKELGAVKGNTPLEGPRGFTKKRVFPDFMDGIRAGFVPIDWNPVRLGLLKLSEINRYVAAHRILDDLDRQGAREYVRIGKDAPAGYRVPLDRAFKVYKSPLIGVKAAHDKSIMDGLMKLAGDLGVKVDTVMGFGRGKGERWGESVRGEAQVRRRFASQEETLTHEIGHQLDSRYGLGKEILSDPQAKSELESLAAERYATTPAKEGYKTYVRKPSELIANLVHAYVHAPDLLDEIAPTARAAFDRIIDQDDVLRGLRNIKPGLEMRIERGFLHAGGAVQAGSYAVPIPIADLLDRHLGSSALRGNTAFEMYRKSSQYLLSARLGCSAYHLAFTSGDAELSKLALAGTYAARGHFSAAAKTLGQAVALQPLTQWMDLSSIGLGKGIGAKGMEEWQHPGTYGEDIAALVRAVELGGFHLRSKVHDLGGYESFIRAIRQENWGRATGKAIPAALELGTRYILNTIVPRQKMAVAMDLARRELLDVQKETGAKTLKEALERANPLSLADRMARANDSVDNRLGQVVYDNLFWNRTFKDLMFGTFQSVGWNLGTVRELGGGVKDVGRLFSPEHDVTGRQLSRVTDRLAYTAMLPVFHALVSSALQVMYTGQLPNQPKDFFFPRTGLKNPDGSDARISPADYMKDVYAYLHGFLYPGTGTERAVRGISGAAQVVMHKLNPMWSMISEMLGNKDFYGTEIFDKNASLAKNVGYAAGYVAKGFVPYAVKGMQRDLKTGASVPASMAPFIGLVPAPSSVVRSPLDNALVEYTRENRPAHALSRERSARNEAKRDIRGAIRAGQPDRAHEAAQEAIESGTLLPEEVRKARRHANSTARTSMFQSVPLRKAAELFELGDPQERQELRKQLYEKYDRALVAKGRGQLPEDLAHMDKADLAELFRKIKTLLADTPKPPKADRTSLFTPR